MGPLSADLTRERVAQLGLSAMVSGDGGYSATYKTRHNAGGCRSIANRGGGLHVLFVAFEELGSTLTLCLRKLYADALKYKDQTFLPIVQDMLGRHVAMFGFEVCP